MRIGRLSVTCWLNGVGLVCGESTHELNCLWAVCEFAFQTFGLVLDGAGAGAASFVLLTCGPAVKLGLAGRRESLK